MKKFIISIIFLSPYLYSQGFGVPSYPDYESVPQRNFFGQTLTSCTIPAGTYRVDARHFATADRISIKKIILKIHVNHGGFLILTLQLKPDGREELYVVNPYGNNVDLSNICSGSYFSIWFKDINLYGKKLRGNIEGSFIRTRMSDYLKVNGYIERYDPSWKSKVTINLNDKQLAFEYPYVE